MTSSIRHMKPGDPEFNFDIHKFKDIEDVFSEPQLTSILFLSYGKPGVTKASLLSTLEALSRFTGELEFIFTEQGNNPLNIELYKSVPAERKVIVLPNRNNGINVAFNTMIAMSRGEFFFLHENDWLNIDTAFNFMQAAKDILNENQNIGIVQLRDPADRFENWGAGKAKYNPMSCDEEQRQTEKVKVYKEQTSTGHQYFMFRIPYGWSHNPALVRKSLFRELGYLKEPQLGSDLRHDEAHKHEALYKSEAMIAYIGKPVYRHIGGTLQQVYEWRS